MPARHTIPRRVRIAAVAAMTLLPCASLVGQTSARVARHDSTPADRFHLEPCSIANIPETVRCGTFWVYEDRVTRRGRRIPLKVIVLPARQVPAAADPVFSLYGGPGQTASAYAAQEWNLWYRDHREVVLVDQRGTGSDAPLDCRLSGTDENPQGYLEPMFQAPLFKTCRAELEKRADLRLYGTPVAADDLDEIRQALGYGMINLAGGSYGARMALVYIRQHGAHVRSAVLLSLIPFSLKNPLYHARGAQLALDSLLATCQRQVDCHTAFPDSHQELSAVLDRLERAPVTVTIQHPTSGKPITLVIGRTQFAEALRVMMYGAGRASEIPMLIHRAFEGDLTAFARQGFASNYGLRSALRYGMLMSTTCSEDVARISEADIIRETRGTFLGDDRVRQEIAACKEWPAARLPARYAEPFRSSVPALLITGRYDPVTPPRFGEEVRRQYLSNSTHLIVEQAGHSVTTPCTESISRQFIERASVAGLDTTCLASQALRPFVTKPPTD
ncbi:MAG: alpha/beta hydrolase [Gemmatimonadetes bacterium]|nr:alpha/beta hydrolase [Gemmatimonadota bacterium]